MYRRRQNNIVRYSPYYIPQRFSKETSCNFLELVVEAEQDPDEPKRARDYAVCIGNTTTQGIRTVRNLQLSISAKFLNKGYENNDGYTVFPYVFFAVIFVREAQYVPELRWPDDHNGYLYEPNQDIAIQGVLSVGSNTIFLKSNKEWQLNSGDGFVLAVIGSNNPGNLPDQLIYIDVLSTLSYEISFN